MINVDKILFPSSSKETYESSMGMFENGTEENDGEDVEEKVNVIADYDISQEEIKVDKKKYIFVRLLKNVYKSLLTPDRLVGIGLLAVDKPAQDGKVYNHASINHELSDDFYGYTFNIKNKSCVNREILSNPPPENFIYNSNIEKSEFIVLGIPMSTSDYNNVKTTIKKFDGNPNTHYNFLSIIFIGLESLFHKRIAPKSQESISDEIDMKFSPIERLKNGYVCSSFVGYVLSQTKSLNKIMTKEKIKYGRLTPTDLYSLFPNEIQMFSGPFKNYDKLKAKFIKLNPQFKEYV